MARDLTDVQMVQPKAIAPYESMDAFELWSGAASAEWGQDFGGYGRMDPGLKDLCDGRGPPWPLEFEDHKTFARRLTVGLFTFIKGI